MFNMLRELKNFPLYKNIMDTIKELKDDKKFSTEEAIPAAISLRKFRINQLIPDELSGDEDEEDDDADEEDDDDEYDTFY